MKSRRFGILFVAVLLAALLVPSVAQAKYSMYSITSWTPRGNTKASKLTRMRGWEWYGSGTEDAPTQTSFVTNRKTKFYFTTSGDYGDLKRVSRNRFFAYLSQDRYAQATPENPNGHSGNVYWRWAKDRHGKRYKLATKVEANIVGE